MEVTAGVGATVYSVYVTLTIESERARFIDSHGGPGQADTEGIFEAGTNQALTVGQTSYLFLVTRGVHGASNFHDEAGNSWNPVYEETAGPFVCQLWASDISSGSTDKATKLVWGGLPGSAYVYRALIAIEGEPVVSDALDVGASSSDERRRTDRRAGAARERVVRPGAHRKLRGERAVGDVRVRNVPGEIGAIERGWDCREARGNGAVRSRSEGARSPLSKGLAANAGEPLRESVRAAREAPSFSKPGLDYAAGYAVAAQQHAHVAPLETDEQFAAFS
jgi:hypothetical protein